MSDIDWYSFAHRGPTGCNRRLWLDDMGATGELNELRVRCECGELPRYISEAAGKDNPVLGRCNGAEPWLDPRFNPDKCEK